MNNFKEIWKDIQGYEGLYQVSNLGMIRSTRGLRNQVGNGYGYLCVDLWKHNKRKRFYVHRLVANAFLKNEHNYPTVNHKDGNKSNNCVSNLEWCTYSYNNVHALKNGLRHSNKNNAHMSKRVEALKDKKVVYRFPSMREAERQLHIANGSVSVAIKKGWKYKGYEWRLVNLNGE